MSEARKWYFKHLLFYFFVIPKEKLKVTALPELELCGCCTLIEKHENMFLENHLKWRVSFEVLYWRYKEWFH